MDEDQSDGALQRAGAKPTPLDRILRRCVLESVVKGLPLPDGRVNLSIVALGYSISGFAVAPIRNEKEKNREIPLFWLLRQKQIRWHD